MFTNLFYCNFQQLNHDVLASMPQMCHGWNIYSDVYVTESSVESVTDLLRGLIVILLTNTVVLQLSTVVCNKSRVP